MRLAISVLNCQGVVKYVDNHLLLALEGYSLDANHHDNNYPNTGVHVRNKMCMDTIACVTEVNFIPKPFFNPA